MALNITVTAFNVETISKGRRSYRKATVTYDYNGKQSQKIIMDFANPKVFETLRTLTLPGQISVETKRNEETGYTDWVSAQAGQEETNNSNTPKAVIAPVRVTGSNYETPDERKERQRLIVRQSSLNIATEVIKSQSQAITLEALFALAEEIATFVYKKDDDVDDYSEEEGD